MQALIVTEKELEELKQQLKDELRKELVLKKTSSAPVPLAEVKRRWFYSNTTDRYIEYADSVMGREFSTYDLHKIWENVRNLTRLIMDKGNYKQLECCDHEVCNKVCDELCKTVFDLRTRKDVQNEIKSGGKGNA